MLDNDKIEQIENRVQNAGLGYDTGTLARTYTKDVKALLDDRKELLINLTEGGKKWNEYHCAICAAIGNDSTPDDQQSLEWTVVMISQQTQKLTAANERADLWQRDCEAAQMRVRELELAQETTRAVVAEDSR